MTRIRENVPVLDKPTRVRVTGSLVFDIGHYSKGLEIHPVYAIDFISAAGVSDLTRLRVAMGRSGLHRLSVVRIALRDAIPRQRQEHAFQIHRQIFAE